MYRSTTRPPSHLSRTCCPGCVHLGPLWRTAVSLASYLPYPNHSIVRSRYSNCYCNGRRLEYKIPNKSILRHRLFKVWRDYFGFELIYDNYDLFMDVLAVKGRQFLLAQMPHAVMVRDFSNATFFRWTQLQRADIVWQPVNRENVEPSSTAKIWSRLGARLCRSCRSSQAVVY